MSMNGRPRYYGERGEVNKGLGIFSKVLLVGGGGVGEGLGMCARGGCVLGVVV